MVKIGSGGATFAKNQVNDEDFILDRLPLAKGRHYQQIYWALQRNPHTGVGVRCYRESTDDEIASIKMD